MRFLAACAALVRGSRDARRCRAHARAADPGPRRRAELARRVACAPWRAARRSRSRADGSTGGRVAVDASKSSQFLSALLMVAPLAEDEVEIVAMPITSRPYVDLTLAVMNAFGISVELRGDDTFRVARRPALPAAHAIAIEPDATAATYFFAAAAITGGRIRVEGLSAASAQSDVRFVEVLERMGCSVERGPNWIAVRGPRYLHGVDVDLNALPGQRADAGRGRAVRARAHGDPQRAEPAAQGDRPDGRAADRAAEARRAGRDDRDRPGDRSARARDTGADRDLRRPPHGDELRGGGPRRRRHRDRGPGVRDARPSRASSSELRRLSA